MERRDDCARPDDGPSVATGRDSRGPSSDRSIPRRGFLAGTAITASVGLAGCGGRLPGSTATVDAAGRRDGDGLVWEYPASAVRGDEDDEGIGYASIRFRAVDLAGDSGRVVPGLTFTLNSTVGNLDTGGYRADRFGFRIGVPRSYDGTAGFRAAVEPNTWPELRTSYGYEGAVRELVVTAPDVDTDGTITVDGRFRSSRATLPRQLHCGFEVRASRSGALGRTIVADGRTTFDVSTLDLPDGVSLG